MIALLLALLVGQTPPSYQNLNGVAPVRFSCDGGVTCTKAGYTLYITGPGASSGGSTPSVSCAADEALRWDGAAWSCISKIRAAYMADAGITATYLPITCAAGEFITCDGSSCSCATPAGSGGSSDAGVSAAEVQRLVSIGGP